MGETASQTQDRWSYGLLKNNICVAPEGVRTPLEIGEEEGVLIRVQGLSVSLFVRGEPVKLAPYLIEEMMKELRRCCEEKNFFALLTC